MNISRVNIIVVFLLMFLNAGLAHAQSRQADSLKVENALPHPTDSTKRQIKDSTKAVLHDSTKTAKVDSSKIEPVDTVKPFIPLYTHGGMFMLPYAPYKTIKKADIQLDNYSGLYDILRTRIPNYPLSLGSYGQFNQFSFFGGTPRDINVRFNGRPMNDFMYGSYNLEQFSPEFMEKAEVLIGTDAVVFSGNSSGAMLNLQEIRYNTARPFTRFVFSQSAFDYLVGDGIYSQNIMKNWNMTFGLKKMSSKGRFTNSMMDSWNVRGILRWNASNKTNVSLTENFTNHFTGTNGGMDLNYSADLYDPFAAVPVYKDLNERVFRHDLTLTASSYLSDDTTSAITEALYFTYCEWNRGRGAELVFTENDTRTIMKYFSRQIGGLIRYEQSFLKFATFRAGGEINYIFLEKSDYNDNFDGFNSAIYSLLTLRLLPGLGLTGGIRAGLQNGNTVLSYGTKADWSVSEHLNIIADLSRSARLPSPSESLSLLNEQNTLALLEGRFKLDKTTMTLNIFARKVENPILSIPVYDSATGVTLISTYSYNSSSREIFGSSLNFETRVFGMFGLTSNISWWILSRTDGKEDGRYPKLLGNIGAFFEHIAGTSVARLGVTFTAMTFFKGENFVPMTRSYVPNQISSNNYYNNFDIYATAKLGDAFIRVTYGNVLSRGYYYVPFYPELDWHFLVSVSWSFMD